MLERIQTMRPVTFEILLVEDNDMDAILVKKNLEKIGLAEKLMRVHDGAEAIDFIFARGKYRQRDANKIPKLILLDMNLPGVHGLQVLENIRRNPATSSIPVIVLTISREDEIKLKSKALGISGYLTKTFDEDTFISAVREIELYWYFFNKPPEPIRA